MKERNDRRKAVHVGRQAIYDGGGDVLAHELLYRERSDSTTAAARDAAATANVLVAAWTVLGIDEVVGGRPAFLNLTRQFIAGELPLPVSPGQVGVEVPNVEVDTAFLAGVASLAEQGFTIVVDNFEHSQGRETLLEYATYVKVNMLGVDHQTIERTVALTAQLPYIETIAYRLENTEAVLQAIDLGFNLFQGNALGSPHVITTHAPAARQDSIAALLSTLAHTDPGTTRDLQRVAEVIEADPALASAFRRAGLRGPRTNDFIHNLVEAISNLDVHGVGSWIQLFATVDTVDSSATEPTGG